MDGLENFQTKADAMAAGAIPKPKTLAASGMTPGAAAALASGTANTWGAAPRQAAFEAGFGGGAAPPQGLVPQTLPPAPSPTKLPNTMPSAGAAPAPFGGRPVRSSWGRPMTPKTATPFGAGRYGIR